jgi:AraC-like DNA-binding protein
MANETEVLPDRGPVVLASGAAREPLLELLQDLLQVTGAYRGSLEVGESCFTARHEESHSARLLCGGSRAATVRKLLRLELTEKRVLTINYAPVEVVLAIRRRDHSCGLLRLTSSDADLCHRVRECQAELERELGYLVMRCQIEQYGLQMLNLDIALCGVSHALRRMEQEMERAGAVILPVILEAEFGAHDVHLAAAIHLLSERQDEPFIAVDCAYRLPTSFAPELENALRRAARGTIFFSGIDLLDLPLQRFVLSQLRENRTGGRAEAARVIASCSRPLEMLSQQGEFDRLLRTELDYLRIHVPPLRSRLEDVPYLIERHVSLHRGGGRLCFDRETAELCRRHSWQENEGELERVSARLAVMSDGERIEVADWHRALAQSPAFEQTEFVTSVEEAAEPAESDSIFDLQSDEDASSEEITTLAVRQMGDLPRRLVEGDFSDFESYSISINRALRYISRRFGQEITLGELAREAYVSPSHLSFLFKRTLGFPFKTVLAFVRIEKARQLLMPNQQLSITEISLEVGFGDLSHFERTFKRLVGTNPREFRRQQLDLAQRAIVEVKRTSTR